jgi:TRAP-type C4-dicarboxylate transport system permease small subunit
MGMAIPISSKGGNFMSVDKTYKPMWVRAINWLSEASGYISAIIIMVASLVVLHQVALRYFFGLPTIWQTEMTIYLLMFTTFVGGAYGLKHNAHVGVDIFSIKLSPKGQAYLRIITGFFCLALTIIVSWKAFEMWWEATHKGWISDTLWGPKLTYPYLILPVGMLLISLQYIAMIYDDAVSLKQEKDHSAQTAKDYSA